MQIVPKGSTPPSPQGDNYAKAQQLRSNAIKAFSGQEAQAIVQNQNQVSPEELGAIRTSETKIQQNSQVVEASPEIPVPNVDTTKQPEDPTLSRQFAQLAKQERILRQKAQQQDLALKAREAAIAAKEAEFTAKDQEYAQKYIQRDYLKNNPLQALAEAEVSYDELTQQILNSNNQQDPRLLATIAKLEAKIQSIEKANETAQNSQKTAQEQQRATAIKQIRTDVETLVNQDPNFETIKATRSSKDVVDLIVRTFDEDGILMSVEDAANEVENHILEEVVKLSQLSKVQKKAQPRADQSNAPAVTQTAQPKAQTAPMKTLTNATAVTRPLSVRERAILAFKGELK